MIPIRIPSAIEYARGINIIVIKPGMASLISSKSSSVTDLNIIRPRMMRIGAVAAAGIARNIGDNIKATPKHRAVARAVSPVLPPWTAPVELSMKVQAAEVPNRLEVIVPRESAINNLFMPAILPSLSANPPFIHTPIAEPVRLNRSIHRNDRTITSISIVKTLSNSNWQKIGAGECGRDIRP